jgi:hypothetical protein
MSFSEISSKYTKDPKLTQRSHDLSLLLRVVAPEILGGIYDTPKGATLYPFTTETIRDQYVPLIKRRPNVPEGTNTIRTHVGRQASMLFGPERFPAIESANEAARKVLNDFIEEAEIEDRMREAVVLGSIGSVAMKINVLVKPPEAQARIYVDNYPTVFLTPTFDPARPDTLAKMTEKYKITGADLAAVGFNIADEDLKKQFWFMREWDESQEIWYVPWTDGDEKEDGFTPQIHENTNTHGLGFCPWLWVKNIALGRRVDGSCQFREALDHAINLDYLESQIGAAIKYTMSPTLVIEKPATAAPVAGQQAITGEAGKTPNTILVIDAAGKAYYVEITAAGIEEAQKVADRLRDAIIECMSGDRFKPKEITAGHQGSKTMAMMQQPMIGLCDQLKGSYGTALKRLLKMVLKIIAMRPVEINDEIVDATALGKVQDLVLTWGAYYAETPQELYQQAQAIDLNLSNGLLSQERGMTILAPILGIADISAELKKVAKDQAKMLARDIALGQAVKATQSLPGS